MPFELPLHLEDDFNREALENLEQAAEMGQQLRDGTFYARNEAALKELYGDDYVAKEIPKKS